MLLSKFTRVSGYLSRGTTFSWENESLGNFVAFLIYGIFLLWKIRNLTIFKPLDCSSLKTCCLEVNPWTLSKSLQIRNKLKRNLS